MAEHGSSISLWMGTATVPDFPQLTKNESADVCIVGAGITGLTAAYLLAGEGLKVIVLDDGAIGGGETQRTTAHLSSVIDDRYYSVEKRYGKIGAQLAYESHNAAIECIDHIVSIENIDCDFKRVDGYLFLGRDQKVELLHKELKAAQSAGFTDARFLDAMPLPGENSVPCILFPRQGQFHILKYLAALAHAVSRMGVRIYTYTHAGDVDDGKPAIVHTTNGPIVKAGSVISATNTPITNWVRIPLAEAPYRTYVIAGKMPADYIPTALYWDTEDPYHYVRTQTAIDGSGQWIIIGGEDHRTGMDAKPEEQFAKLESWSMQMYPEIRRYDYHWSGQIEESMDGLAMIGKDPSRDDNIFIATGDSGMGMTHGTIAAMLLTDVIMGRPNPWSAIYNPARAPWMAPIELFRETTKMAQAYTSSEVLPKFAIVDLSPNEGMIVENDGEKLAVYRDESGQLHQFSAVCPHLKATVVWNSFEHCWECPAHGSRFTCDGEVINGPANENLSALSPEKILPDFGAGAGTSAAEGMPPPSHPGPEDQAHGTS